MRNMFDVYMMLLVLLMMMVVVEIIHYCFLLQSGQLTYWRRSSAHLGMDILISESFIFFHSLMLKPCFLVITLLSALK